jgi:hypothetical protein
VIPFLFAILTHAVLSDLAWFSSGKTALASFSVGVLVLLFGIRDAWDLFYSNDDEPKESELYVPEVVLNYLIVPVSVAIGYGAAVIFQMESPWPALLFGIVTFVSVRSKLIPSLPVPPIGRRLVGLISATIRAARERKGSDKGIMFGGVPLPSHAALTHFCVVGVSGGGKTVTLQLLMQQVLPSVGKGRDVRAVIYDAKRDILSTLAGMGLKTEPVILNPFDARSWAWDMAADITVPTDADEIAAILIPEKSETQPFFTNAARQLVAGTFRSFIKTCPKVWTFRDVLLALQSEDYLRQILEREPITKYLVDMFYDKREFGSIMTTIETRMGRYGSIAAAWDSCRKKKMSLNNWIKEESILVLGCIHKNREAIETVNRLLFHRLHQVLLDDTSSRAPASRRTWVFLDEVPDAGRLEGLPRLFTHARSYGICIVLGFQDLEGLRHVYGDQPADVMLNQCSSKAILRLASAKTAQWASSLAGVYGYAQQQQEVIHPSAFLSLPPTDPKNGLSGYYVTPYVNPYFSKLRGDELFDRMLTKPNDKVDDFQQRPPSELELKPWAEADLIRLGLHEPISETLSTSEDDPLLKLRPVRVS